MSFVNYNNVQLNLIATRDYRMEPVYDDSDTDMLYLRHRLTVLAVVSVEPNVVIQPLGTQAGPAELLATIRHLLSVPRRPFTYNVNGVDLIDVQPEEGAANNLTIDAAKGPFPRVLNVTRITAGSFLVEWAVEYHDAGCDGSDNPLSAQGIVSLRWSQTETVDKRWYRQISTKGYMITRTDMLKNPDVFRSMVVPTPALGGYVRTASEYTQSTDGTRLDFNFRDEQRFRLPPNYPDVVNGGQQVIPVVDGKFAISTGENMAQLWAMVQIHMEGVPGQNTQLMIQIAAAIAINKIAAAGPAVSGGYFQAAGSVTEGIWDNTIDFTLKAKINNTFSQARFEAIALKPGIFGTSTEYSTDPQPQTEGIVPRLRQLPPYLTMAAAAFQDPCLAAAILEDAGDTTPLSEVEVAELQDIVDLGGSGGLDASTPADDAPSGASLLSFQIADVAPVPGDVQDTASLINDQSPGTWDTLLIESTYTRDEHVLQLPTMQADAAAVVVQMASPTARLSCAWTATKLGAPPEVPPYESTDGNLIVAGKETRPEMLVTGSDGQSLKYTINGCYHYLALDASKVDDLACPVPPWLADAGMEIGLVGEGSPSMVLGDAAEEPAATLPNPPVGS